MSADTLEQAKGGEIIHPSRRRYRWPGRYPRPRLWSWAPLEDSIAVPSVRALAELLDVDRTQVYRWRRQGLTEHQADDLACWLGLHPATVWADW